MAYGSGFFRTSYAADMAVVDTRLRRAGLALLFVAALALPRIASPFVIELVSQAALAAVGALALNLLTGMAGQVSLGHAGFLAAGAFTVGVLVEAWKVGPLVTFPAAALVGVDNQNPGVLRAGDGGVSLGADRRERMAEDRRAGSASALDRVVRRVILNDKHLFGP